jgi:SAM-dependent methyltransferase
MAATITSPVPAAPYLLPAQLERAEDGIWYAREREPVSYLEEGNEVCFELEENSFWFQHRADCLKSVVRRFPPAGPIFDIGGGNGFVSRSLIDAGFDAVLVEPGETGARNAARRGIQTVICATLATAKFSPSSIPAVGIFDVLEHVEDAAGFLEEIARCLQPEGRLYITVPAFPWLWSDDDVAAGHYRRYTLATLNRAVKAAGFAPLYSTYLFSPLPLPLLLMRCLPSLFGKRALPRKTYSGLHRQRARWLTDRIWAAERNCIDAGRAIPFGSSCLLVAEKR